MLHQPSAAPAPGICCNAAVAKGRSLGQTEKAIAVPIIFLRVSTKPSFRIHTKDLLQWTAVAACLSMGNLKRLHGNALPSVMKSVANLDKNRSEERRVGKE